MGLFKYHVPDVRQKWVKSCLTINSLSIYCCFFHDNFNLDLNPLFSSELRIEAAAASFNSQLLSHVFVRGCWKHQLLFCCRYCLPAMLPLVLIQLRSRLLGSIIIKDLTLELTRLCIFYRESNKGAELMQDQDGF